MALDTDVLILNSFLKANTIKNMHRVSAINGGINMFLTQKSSNECYFRKE
jgi:hypothetical protein